MSRNNTQNFTRRRSSSLKEKLFAGKQRKRFQSTRARLQTSDSICGREESKSSIKYKFITGAPVQVYTIPAVTSNLWGRLRNHSRFPWNWQPCTVIFGETELYSQSADGVFAQPIPYVNIDSWSPTVVPHLQLSYIKLVVGKNTYLLQVSDAHQRDRILHSVRWKINIRKYEKTLYSTHDADILLSELKDLIKFTIEFPLFLDFTNPTLLEIVSNILTQNQDTLSSASIEALIMTLAPLFEENQPSLEICNFFIKHCRLSPRSRVVIDMFQPVVLRILKYNNNYGKSLWLRDFVKEYILALSQQNDGEGSVREFVRAVHGPLSFCPHKRILNNLFGVCLSGVYTSFSPYEEKVGKSLKKSCSDDRITKSAKENEENICPKYMKSCNDVASSKNQLWEASIVPFKKSKNTATNHINNILRVESDVISTPVTEKSDGVRKGDDWKPDVETGIIFANVLDEISKINDWLHGLAVLLQPIPFQIEAMQCEEFLQIIIQILGRVIAQKSEKSIWCLVGVRDNRDGWLQIFSPQNNICNDDGIFFTKITAGLLESAKEHNKVKKLMKILMQSCLNAVLLLALREHDVMVDVLCYMLEYKLTDEQNEQQIISTLQSTKVGNSRYNELCEKEMVLRQKGGPAKYTLPPRSTDDDLAKVLNNGKCNNLRELILSCTKVTSKSADLIAKLPYLQILDLWSTMFDDLGLRRLCETLNLKSLNLCEVKVTDDGISYLKEMTNLTHLNLNSTRVTADCFQELQENLPKLTSWDVTYTDAYLEDKLTRPQLKSNACLANNGLNNAAGVGSLGPKKLEYKQNV